MSGNNSHYDLDACRIYDSCLLPLSTLCTPSKSSAHTCHNEREFRTISLLNPLRDRRPGHGCHLLSILNF